MQTVLFKAELFIYSKLIIYYRNKLIHSKIIMQSLLDTKIRLGLDILFILRIRCFLLDVLITIIKILMKQEKFLFSIQFPRFRAKLKFNIKIILYTLFQNLNSNHQGDLDIVYILIMIIWLSELLLLLISLIDSQELFIFISLTNHNHIFTELLYFHILLTFYFVLYLFYFYNLIIYIDNMLIYKYFI